jgi:nucleotide-binding universal stress UspA family protein
MSLIAADLKPRSILIASDFSEASEKALRHSLALARFYGSRFCLAHIVSSLGLTMAGPGAIAACEEAVLREASELEYSLVRSGALNGIQHKFIVRQGQLWPELRATIQEESTDLLVIGTHGRRGIAKLFFGSIAERIFRQASCPVLIFGPESKQPVWIGTHSKRPTFLFATDSGHASPDGLAQAIAVANHFEAKLVFLDVLPAASLQQDLHADLWKLGESEYQQAGKCLAELACNPNLDIAPEFHVGLKSNKNASELILETAGRLRADLIVMGLHSSARIGVSSQLNWTTAYDVVCHAISPVLTVNRASEKRLIAPKAAERAMPLLSDADLIRIRGLGVKW